VDYTARAATASRVEEDLDIVWGRDEKWEERQV